MTDTIDQATFLESNKKSRILVDGTGFQTPVSFKTNCTKPAGNDKSQKFSFWLCILKQTYRSIMFKYKNVFLVNCAKANKCNVVK